MATYMYETEGKTYLTEEGKQLVIKIKQTFKRETLRNTIFDSWLKGGEVSKMGQDTLQCIGRWADLRRAAQVASWRELWYQ